MSDPNFNLRNPAAAADYTGYSVSHLAKLRLYGGGPSYLKLGHRTVMYDVRDLDAWLVSKRRRSTSDVGAEAA
jgi:hypothetical protein